MLKQNKQVQQLLPVLKKMELSEPLMCSGITATFTLMVRVILLVYSVRVVTHLMDIQHSYPHQSLMDLFVITME